MESEARQARSRLRGRPRSPSVGAVHKVMWEYVLSVKDWGQQCLAGTMFQRFAPF